MLSSAMALTANAQKGHDGYDWTRVINAIIQVESSGNKNARNPVGDCCGIMQITPVVVKQCNIWLRGEKSSKRYTLQDRYNPEKSKEMFLMTQKYYNPKNDVEKAIRIWNGGPKYSVAKTNGYLKKVMKHYRKMSSAPQDERNDTTANAKD